MVSVGRQRGVCGEHRRAEGIENDDWWLEVSTGLRPSQNAPKNDRDLWRDGMMGGFLARSRSFG